MSSRKRARTAPRASRPISKSLILINKINLATQAEINLLTATFPCTVVGLRWSLSTLSKFTAPQAADSYINWVIVIVKEGNTAGALPDTTPGGQTFYNPEQNVLAWGSHALMAAGSDQEFIRWDGDTRDKMVLLALVGDSQATEDALFGTVQFFCKT